MAGISALAGTTSDRQGLAGHLRDEPCAVEVFGPSDQVFGGIGRLAMAAVAEKDSRTPRRIGKVQAALAHQGSKGCPIESVRTFATPPSKESSKFPQC